MTARKLSRRTDPVSSHEAAAEHVQSGRNAAQKTVVLDGLSAYSNVTSDELARLLRVDRYMVARRLPELESEGLVMRSGSRPSEISGRTGVTWRLVEEGVE